MLNQLKLRHKKHSSLNAIEEQKHFERSKQFLKPYISAMSKKEMEQLNEIAKTQSAGSLKQVSKTGVTIPVPEAILQSRHLQGARSVTSEIEKLKDLQQKLLDQLDQKNVVNLPKIRSTEELSCEVDLEERNRADSNKSNQQLNLKRSAQQFEPIYSKMQQPTAKHIVSRPTSTGSSNNVKKVNIVVKPTSQTGIIVQKINNFMNQPATQTKAKAVTVVTSPPQNQMKSKQMSPANLKVLKHTLNSAGNGAEQLKNSVGESLINISVKKNVNKPGTQCVPTLHPSHFNKTPNLTSLQLKQASNLSAKQAANFSRPSSNIQSGSNKRNNGAADFSSPTLQPSPPNHLGSGPISQKIKFSENQPNAMEVLKRNVKNGKKYLQQDQNTQELQRSIKLALTQLSNGNLNMLSEPQNQDQSNMYNNLMHDLIALNQKSNQTGKQNSIQPRSSSEKTQPTIKKTPQIKTKKQVNSIGSTQNSGMYNSRAGSGTATQRQHDVKISKPTFNVQINNNVSNIGGQQTQQNSLMDSAQIFAVVSAAAQLSLKQQKRAGSEDNAIQQLQKQKISEAVQQQRKSQQNKARKNNPSLAGSESRGNSQNRSLVSQPPVLVAQNSSASLTNLNEFNGAVGIKVEDNQIVEREKLIAYIKNYIQKKNELPPTTLEFYRFVKLIGKGAFGKVTLGVHKLTGNQVAIKTIEKAFIKDEFSKRKVFQEVYLLKKIKHSNVIRLLEVFESPKHLLIVMEYAGGGDLLRLIKRRGKLDETDSKYIFKQIVYGMAHIHCRSVIHRDIKLDNILLDSEKGVKICDFGVSKIIKKGEFIKEQCGTPAYLAPEIIIDQGYQGFFVDVWSLGVLLFAMLLGTVPFKAGNLDDLHKLIIKGDFTIPDEVSAEAKSIIRGMIQLEPKARLSVPEILAHPWLKETNEEDSEDEAQDDVDQEEAKKNESDPDLQKIQGNVNYVNVDNLFYSGNYKCKLSYTDYCCVTEDFATQNIDEEALKVCENFGYPRHFLIKCLNRGDINHATACYFLLTNSC